MQLFFMPTNQNKKLSPLAKKYSPIIYFSQMFVAYKYGK